ncbi:dihydrolipoyllysine-residue acetyltransferase [Halochromatium sp.]
MATVEDVLLPDIGDFADVEIIEILVAEGDQIEPEQSLLTLESDKATMEIPAPFGGEVKEVAVKVGERVAQGQLLMRVATSAAAGAREGASEGTGKGSGASNDEPSGAGEKAAPAQDTSTEQVSRPAPASTSIATGPAAGGDPGDSAARSTASASSAGTEKPLEVRLPDIGDFSDIPVIEVLVSPGDQIEVDQSIATLESEKATMEIPSPSAGTVEAVHIQAGDKINQGDLMLTLKGVAQPTAEARSKTPSAEEDESAQTPADTARPEGDRTRAAADTVSDGSQASSASRAPGEAERRKAPILPRPADMQAIASGRTPHASPAIRRFARELGVDLAQVKGSGRKGRILKDDVQAYVKKALSAGSPPAASGGMPFQLPAAPEVDFSKFGATETQPLSRIKKLSGTHLHRAWLSVPHVTQFDEADITELEAFRKGQKQAAEEAGVKLTFMPFLVKAVAGALAQMPTLKASLSADGEQLILKHYTHIGVAVDTPNGLVVPVIRDADKKGLFEIARELMALSGKAREGKLLPGDMQGGVFSISSLGGIGGTAFTPIVNAPEVAILGVSRTETKPVWNGEAFEPRLMLPLSLSYDHRVVDGADGVRFTTLLAGLLSDIRRLLL